MDWKYLFRAVLVFIPQLEQAVKWLNQHVKNYSIETNSSKVTISIDVDTTENAKLVETYLTEFLEMIMMKKPNSKH